MLLNVLLILGVALAVPTDTPQGCQGSASWGRCEVVETGGSLEISAESGGGTVGGGADGGGASDSGDGQGDAGDGIHCDDPLGRCGYYEVVVRPEPTLTDVASFAPWLEPVKPEPEGIGILGMPVNLVAAATSHTRTGELFDLPVTVRFRPVSFHFDYGDGATRVVPTGGRTWQQLGAPQFTPTETSHVYTRRGTYTARATVSFEAHVDFGHGWERVSGLLSVPAGSSQVEVLEAHTGLVERTCREDPRGVGC